MMIGTPFACPHHAQMPHLEFPWGQEDDFRSSTFPSVSWERLLGKEVVYCGYLIHLPTHCTPCPVLFVLGALSPAHLADSSSLFPQTQAPPCLQTPQPRAQARSPLCHLHSEEPARHLSPSLPMKIKVPGRALPPPLGLFPSWRAHHYVRKALPAPSKAPTKAPVRGLHFYIRLFKDFCFKDLSNVWEEG